MAKRTPVAKLDVSGISTKPVANLVETYVRPAQIQPQLSPLSEFVNAITPAVKAVSDKQLEEKLKREREIESFRLQQKNQQIEHQALKAFSRIQQDYASNPDMWHEQETSTIINSIDKNTSDYTDVLKQKETDPLLIEKYRYVAEDAKIKFIAAFTEGKRKYEINKQNQGISEAFLDQEIVNSSASKEEQVEAMINLVNKNAYTYLIKDAKGKLKPDFKRINTLLVTAAEAKAKSNPDNVLYLAAEKLGLLTNPKYAKTMNDLKAKRANHILKNSENASLASNIQYSLENDVPLNPIKTDSKGNKTKASDIEISDAFLKSSFMNKNGVMTKFLDLSPLEQAQRYQKSQYVPIPAKNAVRMGLPFMSGDFTQTVETNEKIQQSLNQWKLYTGVGIPFAKLDLTADENRKFEALDLLMNREAKQKQYIIHEVLNEAGDESSVVEYTAPDYNAAAITIQQKFDDELLPKLDSDFVKDVKTETEKWLGKDLTDVPSSAIILREITKDARFFMALGADKENSIKRAFAIADKNNPIVETGAGDSYRFNSLAANVAALGKRPEVILKEINKKLFTNPAMQAYAKETLDLDADEFDIAIKADVIDENKVRVYLINKSKKNDFFTEVPLFDSMDKTKILSDPNILYNVVTKNMEQAKLAENKAKVTLSYSTPTTTEADDFSNIIQMINPESKGQFEKTVALGKEGQVTPPSKGILKDIGDGIESTIKYVLNSFGDPMVQNSEAIGALSTKLGKVLTDPIIKLISDEIEKTKNFEGFNTLNNQDVQDDKQSSLLDLINPISTATASVLDETQVGEFIPSNQPTGEQVTIEGNTTEEKTANMIATQEGFSNTPYKDGKDRSVGYGFYLPALEPDERALIKDVNNVTKEEGAAVLRLKVQKISNYLDQEIQGFRNLPEKAQSAIISMGYQLGVTNIPKTWKKFTAHIKEAAQYAEGSIEQANALLNANFEMLYNVAKDGTISLNKWATQTKKRAFEMAEAVIEDINLPNLISSAEASTLDTLKASDLPTPRPKDLKGTVINVLDEDKKSSNIIAAPYKALLSNIVGIEPNFNTEDIGEDTLSVINQATANAEARGSNSVEYGDYPLTKRGLKVGAIIANFKDISGKRLSSEERKQMEKEVNEVYPNNPIGLAMLAYDLATDPVLKAAGFVGGFSIQKDSEGNKFIKERWNFNNKSTSEGTIYKKMRSFFSKFAPITEDEGSEVFVKLASK
jgi:GH24 family phage-related lysozyme (muramidase)